MARNQSEDEDREDSSGSKFMVFERCKSGRTEMYGLPQWGIEVKSFSGSAALFFFLQRKSVRNSNQRNPARECLRRGGEREID